MVTFADEYATFEQVRRGLARDHAGKYVVILGSRVIGVYSTAVLAFEAGLQVAGPDRPFLIECVREVARPMYSPAYVHGLLDAAAPW